MKTKTYSANFNYKSTYLKGNLNSHPAAISAKPTLHLAHHARHAIPPLYSSSDTKQVQKHNSQALYAIAPNITSISLQPLKEEKLALQPKSSVHPPGGELTASETTQAQSSSQFIQSPSTTLTTHAAVYNAVIHTGSRTNCSPPHKTIAKVQKHNKSIMQNLKPKPGTPAPHQAKLWQTHLQSPPSHAPIPISPLEPTTTHTKQLDTIKLQHPQLTLAFTHKRNNPTRTIKQK